MMCARSTDCRPSFSDSASRSVASDTKPSCTSSLPSGDVRLGLLEQRDAQLVLGEDPLVDQDLADVALGLRIGGRIHPDGDDSRSAHGGGVN